MSVLNAPVHGITDEFVARLAQRAKEAERLRRLPAETVAELRDTGIPSLLLPTRLTAMLAIGARISPIAGV